MATTYILDVARNQEYDGMYSKVTVAWCGRTGDQILTQSIDIEDGSDIGMITKQACDEYFGKLNTRTAALMNPRGGMVLLVSLVAMG